MDFLLNARLRRSHYWLSLIGIVLVSSILLVVLISTGTVSGRHESGLRFVLIYPAMGWALASRARDAGRNVAGWTIAGLVVPLCFIIVGCFGSRGAFDAATLRRTFE